ncbi:MAG TPA: hypothetical protein DEH75_01490 [Bradyrhizobium sp.]|jgi:hypothetical protein|nr:hypothetical protein [Bradyrhizobium sp.]HAR16977.1 hypothetical protein [Bradyrhizobium sp.]HAR26130.1 hypothetical protein [Bradyrhizobium sp.]HBY25222.1 hypothetical protein [Bradyrhizobium sp.]
MMPYELDSCAIAYALKLPPLVFVRSGELRQAEWTEFSLAEVVSLSRTSTSSTCWRQGAPEVSAPVLVADVRSLS